MTGTKIIAITITFCDMVMWVLSNVTTGFAQGVFTGLGLILLFVALFFTVIGLGNERRADHGRS